MVNVLSEDDLSRLLSSLEAAYNRGLLRRAGIRSNAWSPPTDVYEANDRLIVCIEIAGMREGEFHVTLHEHALVVTGVRARSEEHPRQALHHQLEIRHGEFRAEVALPWPVDRSQVEAGYRDGFLWIELPRRPEHIINIRVGEDNE
jgi:HSP20 family molecular chaperone IbpA